MFELLKKGINIFSVLILSVGFLGSGMLCLVNYPALVSLFQKWGYPASFMYIIGVMELAIALMIFHKPWRKFGIGFGFIVMTGAIFTHLKSNEYNQLYGPIIVLMLLVSLIFTEIK